MDKEESINVRLDVGLKDRVNKVARSCGSSPSMLIRMLLIRFVEHAEAHGGRVVMPPDFKEFDIRNKK